MTATLPPFPVHDQALDVLEHALGGAYDWDEAEDVPVLVGAEFSPWQVLDFYAGYDPARLVPTETPDVSEYPGPTYHPNDVITALIAEVRRLRTVIAEGRT